MIKALIWSEWRRQRWAVAVLAIVTVGLWSVFFSLMKMSGNFIFGMAHFFMLFFPFVAGYALTSDVFASEFKHKTVSFLGGLPVSSSRIYWCKYCYTLLTVLLACCLNYAIFDLWFRLNEGQASLRGEAERLFFVLELAVLVHVIVFFASLLRPRAFSGVAAILLLPVLLAVLAPAVVLPALWLGGNWTPADFNPLTVCFSLFWLILMLFGWYLWTKRLAVGLSITKPLVVAAILTMMLTWSFYGIAYAYAAYDLARAEQEARAAGLIMDLDKMAPPPLKVPSSQNAAVLLQTFTQECKQSSGRKFYFNTAAWWNLNYDHLRGKKRDIRMQTIISKAELLLKDPEFKRLKTILDKILQQTAFVPVKNDRLDPYYKAFYGPQDAWDLHNLASLMKCQAVAYILTGQEQDFFSSLEQFSILPGFCLQVPYVCNRNDAAEALLAGFRLAVTAGPVTPSALSHYRKMLTQLDRALMVKHNDISRYKITWKLRHISFPAWLDWLIWPGYLKNAAEATRFDIAQDKLLKLAIKKNSLPEITAEYRLFNAKRKRRSLRSYDNDRIYSWFHIRSQIEFIRLALELKIYRIEHGAFPEKLSPQTIPAPINPLTGKPFEYRREGDGFAILGGEKTKKNEPLIYYQPLPATQHSEVSK